MVDMINLRQIVSLHKQKGYAMAQYVVRITEYLSRTGTITIEAATDEDASSKIDDLLMGDSIDGDLDAPGVWDDESSEKSIAEICRCEDGSIFFTTDALLDSAVQEV
jgi:hypothetical protein